VHEVRFKTFTAWHSLQLTGIDGKWPSLRIPQLNNVRAIYKKSAGMQEIYYPLSPDIA
jgi:hypothetical protein